MARISKLGHVGIYVNDLDRSIRFYRDLLGLTVTDHAENLGFVFLSSRPEEEHHEFQLTKGRTVGSAAENNLLLQQISFSCPTLDDVIGHHRALTAAGVPIDMTVTHGYAVGCYFFDPDGNRCEVYWQTGVPARQPFLAPLDLTRPVEEIRQEVLALAHRYADTGYVDTDFLARQQIAAFDAR